MKILDFFLAGFSPVGEQAKYTSQIYMLKVLYEDNHVIAVAKPAGTLVQGDKSGALSLMDEVKDYLKNKYNKPGNVFLGLVHRLDRNVAGIVIFAKTSKGASRLSEQFREHDIGKNYNAWVEGKFDKVKANLVHYIRNNERTNKVDVFKEPRPGALEARLFYEVLSYNEVSNISFIKIELMTGRHHQIRAQLSATGHPIVGDVKYGSKYSFEDQHIELCATELKFRGPTTGEEIDLKLEVTNQPPELHVIRQVVREAARKML